MSGDKDLVIWLDRKPTRELVGDVWFAMTRTGVANLFKWTGWSLLVGGLGYVQSATSDLMLGCLYLLLLLGLTVDIVGTVFSVKLVWGDKEWPRKLRRREFALNWVLIGVVGWAAANVASQTSFAFTEFQSQAAANAAELDEAGKQ